MYIDRNKVVWTGITGRNGKDTPIALRDDEAVEVLNVDFSDGALGAKRRGSTSVTLTDGPTSGAGSLLRYVPADDETQATLWAAGGTALYRRPPNPTNAWVTPTLSDAPSSASGVDGAALNGKFFLAYNSAVNRLHVWNGPSGGTVRRVGLAPADAPTVANTGAGAYAATLRYYRVAWADISGSVTLRRGELSSEASFTPSGAGTAARLTRPARPNEEESHWLVYASSDGVYSNYHLIATVPVLTTTYDDSTAPASYTGDAPQIAGINIPPPSAKYIISDGNRLLMAGAHETSTASGQTEVKNNRVWYTRVLGSSGIGDDETIPNTAATGLTPAQKNWIDVGENDGGIITGLALVSGIIYVFKPQQIWRLVPTGDDLQPYRAINMTREVGCLRHQSIVLGEDAQGAPALYFYSYRGPYRLSVDGVLTYIGRPIEDVWYASTSKTSVFGVYHAELRQVWHYLAAATVGAARIAVLDVHTGGWSLFTVPNAWDCAVMFSNTVTGSDGSKVASSDQRPYFGGTDKIFRYDADGATDDNGTTFQAYIQSKPYFPAGIGRRVLTHDAVLLAETSSGVTITLTVTRDFGAETKTATALLTASGSETRTLKRLEESGFGGLGAVQFTVGDSAAIANAWVLDALAVPVTPQESLS